MGRAAVVAKRTTGGGGVGWLFLCAITAKECSECSARLVEKDEEEAFSIRPPTLSGKDCEGCAAAAPQKRGGGVGWIGSSQTVQCVDCSHKELSSQPEGEVEGPNAKLRQTTVAAAAAHANEPCSHNIQGQQQSLSPCSIY